MVKEFVDKELKLCKRKYVLRFGMLILNSSTVTRDKQLGETNEKLIMIEDKF